MRNSRFTTQTWIAPLALLGLMVAVGPAVADSVRTESGLQNGTVVSVSKTAVKLSKSGTTVDIPVNEIIEVSFDDEHFDVKAARNMVKNGQLEDALARIRNTEPAGREFVGHEVDFIRAYCMGRLALAGAEDKAKATAALSDFARKAPNSFHFFTVAELLGDLAVSSGDYAGAARYYGALTSAPWPDYKMRAMVLEGRALLAQDKAPEALAKFEQVLGVQTTVSGTKRQKDLATIGKAAALAQTGKPDEGTKLVEKVIEEGDPKDAELYGRAYNTLGLCRAKQDQKKQALLAYLHTDILFYGDPETHAESLFNLSALWRDLNNPDEATAARNLLHDRYPGSSWANK